MYIHIQREERKEHHLSLPKTAGFHGKMPQRVNISEQIISDDYWLQQESIFTFQEKGTF